MENQVEKAVLRIVEGFVNENLFKSFVEKLPDYKIGFPENENP